MVEDKTVNMISPLFSRCGISTYTEQLAPALAARGMRVPVTVLHRVGQRDRAYFEWLGGYRTHPDATITHCQHEYGLYGGFEEPLYGALRAKGAPVVTTMHSVGLEETDGFIISNSEAVICHNDATFRQLPQSAANVYIIPHGVQPAEPLKPEKAKEKLGLDPDQRTVGMFGFVGFQKGHDLAVRAVAASDEDIKLIIAGGWHIETETQFMERLRRYINLQAPDKVLSLGWIPRGEVSDVLGAMDVVLHPNRSASESGAMLTAIGHGKCVLARNEVSVPAYMEKVRAGIVAGFVGSQQLRLRIEELTSDEKTRGGYEAAARRYAEENSWERVAETHERLYNRIL